MHIYSLTLYSLSQRDGDICWKELFDGSSMSHYARSHHKHAHRNTHKRTHNQAQTNKQTRLEDNRKAPGFKTWRNNRALKTEKNKTLLIIPAFCFSFYYLFFFLFCFISQRLYCFVWRELSVSGRRIGDIREESCRVYEGHIFSYLDFSATGLVFVLQLLFCFFPLLNMCACAYSHPYVHIDQGCVFFVHACLCLSSFRQ